MLPPPPSARPPAHWKPGSPRKALQDGKGSPALSGLRESAVDESREPLMTAALTTSEDLERARHQIRQAVNVERCDHHEQVGIIDGGDEPRIFGGSSRAIDWQNRDRRAASLEPRT
jgi:hypothetical protein